MMSNSTALKFIEIIGKQSLRQLFVLSWIQINAILFGKTNINLCNLHIYLWSKSKMLKFFRTLKIFEPSLKLVWLTTALFIDRENIFLKFAQTCGHILLVFT